MVAPASGAAAAADAARCIVGIDLGTTHTVVAWAEHGATTVQLFEIEQAVAPGALAARPLLPSLRYHPAPGELDAATLALAEPPGAAAAAAGEPDQPDSAAVPALIGTLARQLGAQVPGRLVSSAKSWLSHAGVDRLAPILPWGAPAEVAKVSPVTASASYLAHVRRAWNRRFPARPLEQQHLVLTVPASFDDTARALTLAAARQAGLPRLKLLEEPQAAFQHWLQQQGAQLAAALGPARLVLVCDVGGGTTDLSLIQVEPGPGAPQLRRIAVGQHLMLGGDNMDLALAHLAESRLRGADGPRLAAAQWSQLVERCRAAKETLLAAEAPAQCSVTLLGGGSRLIGAARRTELGRDEVRQLLLDGFVPLVAPDAAVQRRRAGLVEFGLPYASDSAITRHLAEFLRQHAAEARAALGSDAAMPVPDTLLLNGGVFRAPLLAERLQAQLQQWREAAGQGAQPLRVLHNAHPDAAVAQGAVAHVLARQGAAPRLLAGAPRSIFLRLEESPAAGKAAPVEPGSLRATLQAGGRRTAPPARPRGLCLLPRGSEPGHEQALPGRRLALRLGEPVRFQLLSSTSLNAAAGELLELDPERCQPLPPIATVLQAPPAETTPGGRARRELTVQLISVYTELGTLQLQALTETGARIDLEFELRGALHAAPVAPADAAEPASGDTATTARQTALLQQAVERLDRCYGPRSREADTKLLRQLRAALEQLLGRREQWPLPLLRALFDALWQRARARRRSAEHERLWLNLAGWCLRPGVGAVLDDWRIEQLWSLHAAGVQHRHDPQVCTQWWTLWRRVAAGLPAPAQEALLQDLGLNLQHLYTGEPRPGELVPGREEEMLRLAAALTRIAVPHKVEVGAWLLQRLQQLSPDEAVDRTLLLWTLGRLGARQPLQGGAHSAVPAEVAAEWLGQLLPLDWKRQPEAAFAAVQLGRLTGDRARDIAAPLRLQLIERLEAARLPARWAELLRTPLELDAAEQQQLYGEALPPGLRLLEG